MTCASCVFRDGGFWGNLLTGGFCGGLFKRGAMSDAIYFCKTPNPRNIFSSLLSLSGFFTLYYYFILFKLIKINNNKKVGKYPRQKREKKRRERDPNKTLATILKKNNSLRVTHHGARIPKKTKQSINYLNIT